MSVSQGTTTKTTEKKSSKEVKVGALLKRARLDQKKKIAQAVKALHISENYLRAIEEDDAREIPSENSYTLGFLRAYAQFLKLDPVEMVELYKKQHNIAPQETREELKRERKEKPSKEAVPSKDPNPILLWGSMLAAFLILVGSYFQDHLHLREGLGALSKTITSLF